MGELARRRIVHSDEVIRQCHQEGHHWEAEHKGWRPEAHKDGVSVLRKIQKCVRSGVGCGSRRVLTISRKTLRPLGRPRIIYPTDSQGTNLYRYDRPVSRWELRAQEAAQDG